VVVVASGVVSSVVVGALTEVIGSGGSADVAGDSTLKKIKQKNHAIRFKLFACTCQKSEFLVLSRT
jgi:hypothetical protein